VATSTTNTTGGPYDDPDTDEKYILKVGIHTQSDLRAVMARPDKSATLLAAIISYALGGEFRNQVQAGLRARVHDMLMPLLDEPNLRSWDLLCMTRALRGFGPLSCQQLRVAICAHPRTVPDSPLGASTLLGAVWDVTPATAAHVALATGTLRVAAIAWVRRLGPTDNLLGHAGITRDQRQAITDTSRRWATWAGDNPARTAFLLTASFNFECEDDMFAAGAALTAPAVDTA